MKASPNCSIISWFSKWQGHAAGWHEEGRGAEIRLGLGTPGGQIGSPPLTLALGSPHHPPEMPLSHSSQPEPVVLPPGPEHVGLLRGEGVDTELGVRRAAT